jgi:hypothetical protein
MDHANKLPAAGCAGALAQYAPPLSHCPNRPSGPLVIMAGQGKTGTSSLASVLRSFGYTVGHWQTHLCPNKATLSTSRCDRSSLAWDQALAQMLNDSPRHYSSVDWCKMLMDIGAIGDVPVSSLFPFIFARHSNARVILTVRDSTSWVSRRADWSGVSGWADPAPFGWISWPSAGQAFRSAQQNHSQPQPRKVQNIREYIEHVGTTASAWAYFAEMALVACLVPASQLTILDVFDNTTDKKRWRAVGRAVGRAVPHNPGKFWGPNIG